jgi:DtxR family Mn-dependent transcriptional regulator
MVTERIEDYLEALNFFIKKKGYAKVKDISTYFEISPSSVTEMFQKLEKLGYINYEKYGGVTLTKNGEDIAINTRKKHDTLYKFLQIFDIPDDIANEDACHIEHVVHKKTMLRLTQFVEFINSYEKKPRWLEHFQLYYKTGTMPRCDRIRTLK